MSKMNMAGKTIPGAAYAAVAYITWGFLPLYWKALKQVPAYEVMAHRILWSFLTTAVLLFLIARIRDIKVELPNTRKLLTTFLGGILVSLNWLIFIWAVNNNHVVEASLGYYINPLISVILGVLFLKEKLSSLQKISIVFAAFGVGIITISYGNIPWISLTLAVTFGIYGLIKKTNNLSSMLSLTLETAIVMPASLIYLFTIHAGGSGTFGASTWLTTLLLCGTGIITVFPLICFTQGARRITLTTLGFIQYLSPSISLLIGVFVFGEAFTVVHAVSFGFIWLALAIFALSSTSLTYKLIPAPLIKTETSQESA